jgi:predicted lactoylglutathione lyase
MKELTLKMKIMATLPVKDLKKSINFFTQLGFSFNQQFTDEQATCMVIGENIFAMLLVEERFQGFYQEANLRCKEKYRSIARA